MAIATVSVTGKVVKPNGSGVDGGQISITLSTNGTVDDAGTQQVIGGTFVVNIGSDGTVSFSIVPNSGTGSITPAGTTYKAVFEAGDGDRWTKTWSVAASPGSQDIGDL